MHIYFLYASFSIQTTFSSPKTCFPERGTFTEVFVCDLESGTLHAAKRLRQTSNDQMFRCYEVGYIIYWLIKAQFRCKGFFYSTRHKKGIGVSLEFEFNF